MLILEYLVTIKVDSKSYFLTSIDSFKNFIASDSRFTFDKKILKYKNEDLVEIETEINQLDNNNQNEIYYNVFLKFKEREDPEIIESFKRQFIIILKKIANDVKVNLIQDNLGSRYSEQAYRLIHDVENLMRVFIAKFMTINIGSNWFEKHTPKIGDKNKDLNYDLYESTFKIDFIDLNKILFEGYRITNTQDLDNEIKKLENNSPIDKEKVLNYLSKSNWERYFKDKVKDINEAQLEKDWKRIYDIRCDVAHNRFLSSTSFNETLNLCTKISDIIKKTINEIDNFKLKEEEKEAITETFVSISNEKYIRLGNLARSINVGISTIAEFLYESGHKDINANPNQRITLEQEEIVKDKFKGFEKLWD